jgi:hypothetical protein
MPTNCERPGATGRTVENCLTAGTYYDTASGSGQPEYPGIDHALPEVEIAEYDRGACLYCGLPVCAGDQVVRLPCGCAWHAACRLAASSRGAT